MYLKKFIIKNFRGIQSLTLEFNKGANVLIGENNSGKSSIIDALRLCFGYGNQLREIGVKPSDFYINKKEPQKDHPKIEFHLHFEIEDPNETRYFYEMIHQDKDDNSLQAIQLHFEYRIELKDEKELVRWEVWGGTNRGQPINYYALRFIDYTFLDALRDATHKLRPYTRQNKLAQLFDNLVSYKNNNKEEVQLDKEKKKELAQKLEDWLKDNENEWKYLIQEGKSNVNEHLNKSEIEAEKFPIDIAFSGYDYKDIVNNLLIRIPIFDELGLENKEQKYFTLEQNGLGQNNLIYAATILGDLLNRKEKGYYHALLIEEPEAHLHPQKQNTFFSYLNKLKENDIQIFVTSHSPTITAKTDLEYVTVLQKNKNQISSVPIKDTGLSVDNKKYLRKFLDVTKSQLFFAKGVLLVEGISEALLLPIFSKIITNDLEKHGIEIVNIGGVSFEHFAKLFNNPDDEESKLLFSRCSIISDNDQGLIQIKDFISDDESIDKDAAKEIFNRLSKEGYISPKNRVLIPDIRDDNIFPEKKIYISQKLSAAKNRISSRANNLLKIEGRNLDVNLANYTFEYELMMSSVYNLMVIKRIYKEMHPDTIFNHQQKRHNLALEMLEKIETNKDKSELAHRLSIFLEEEYKSNKPNLTFSVPHYIEQAINWVVNGPTNGETKENS